MARVSKLRRPVAICRRGNNLNGGVFSYDKNPHLPQNCDKKMLCWKSSEGAREKREEGDRRSGLSVTIECFHSRGQHLCKFIGTKESVCIRMELNSQRIG